MDLPPPLNDGIDAIIDHLRRMPHLPAFVLNFAEKVYRLYKLNRLDHDLEALREATATALYALEKLAIRVKAGESKLDDLRALVIQQQKTIASLQAAMRPGTTAGE